jgi:gliding motility-associated-like protein
MSGNGTDPNTCGQVPVVSPNGGNFSARLGNSNVGAEAEGLRFDLFVDPDNPLLLYEYAVVFENPGHEDWEQPNFQTRILLENGDTVICTEYRVTAESNLPGFQACPGIDSQGNTINITYKNWTTVGVDLSFYAGTTITLEFMTGDCALGGHYGYAYVDGISCLPLTIDVQYCVDDDFATLTAPPGFAYYNWSTGDTGQSIIVDPQANQYVTCQLISYSGCMAEIVAELLPEIINVDFTAFDVCHGSPVTFTSTVSVQNAIVASYYWSFGDGQSSTAINPIHSYAMPGLYNVVLTVTTESGCSNMVVHTVRVNPMPTSVFQPSATNGCQPLVVNFNNTSANGYSWYWNFGDGTYSAEQNPSHTYATPGTYVVTLVVTSVAGCVTTQNASAVITVYPTPTSGFILDPMETDELSPEVTFTNLSSGGTYYVWNFGDGNYSTATNPVHNYGQWGNYTITLQTTNINGCVAYSQGEVVIKPVFSFYVPNAFTPNPEDQINGLFAGMGTHYKQVRMMIFDRWGIKIFDRTSEEPPVWDGTIDGIECQIDVYEYLIYVTDKTNFIHVFRGSVCLVR